MNKMYKNYIQKELRVKDVFLNCYELLSANESRVPRYLSHCIRTHKLFLEENYNINCKVKGH